ncbi:pyrolysin [Cyathus striatus]|nr:pyrolysin [Cyathus striatus]
MRSFSYLALLPALLCAISVHTAHPISSVKKESNIPTVPNKFIVEVDDLSDIQKRSFARPHEYLYRSLKERDVAFDIDKEYDASGLFVGAALTLNNANDAETLLNTPGVKAIRPVRKFARPKPVKSHVVTGTDDSTIPPDSESTHTLTGVDRLHAQGITGKGINIGIIDTGIDYTHPALGGGFGPGHKVVGGYDFVGDAYTGSNTPVPDSDPLDQCEGHGTHVAGIIGADPINPFNISGVAYGASISAYRIFGCEGFVSDDIIVEALLRGVTDKQDILTLSLGGADGWTESSSNVVASRIASSGKVVTIAAGNDGSSGSWYTSSPGNGIDVISVASLDNTIIPLQNATVEGVEHDPITYFSTFPFSEPGPFPIYALSNDTTIANDACSALPDSTPDLSNFVTIIRRGTCSFVQKLTNAAAKGAKIALIYDNGNGFAGISVGTFEAALIQSFDGEFLVSQFAAGKNITVTFPQSGASTNFPDPEGGLISSFTSYGPSNDFFFKPAVAAPGGNILSTLPVPLGSYGVLSGTSMATPFVAGSAALLLSVKGTSASVAKGARTLFETTAQTISSSHTDGDPLQTVTQQGSGLINVFDAIHATTIVSPGELILNDTAHYKSIQTFTVKNTGKTTKKYTLTHVAAGTALTVDAGTIFPAVGPVPLDTSSASVSIVPKSFTLLPGATLPVVAVITPPKNVDKSTYPVFSGFINIVSGTDKTHVTYLGLAASLKDKQVVDNTDEFFGVALPAILDSNGGVQDSPTNYTFVGDDFPTVIFRLAFGTPLLRIDLVDSNIKVTTTLNTRELEERGLPWFSFPTPIKGGTFSNVKILGALSELDYVTRNNEDADDNGYNTISLEAPTFANGTTIPNGAYRFLLRALKVTGDRTKQEDYETWLSPIVGVQSA